MFQEYIVDDYEKEYEKKIYHYMLTIYKIS